MHLNLYIPLITQEAHTQVHSVQLHFQVISVKLAETAQLPSPIELVSEIYIRCIVISYKHDQLSKIIGIRE